MAGSGTDGARRELYTAYPRPILWLVPGGEVTVGGGESASPRRTAAVEPFYLSKLPVSNRELEAFAPGFVRSPVSPGDRDPAVGVSWQEAAAYCARYAEVARKPIRLPTELEWEHACRAGAAGPWFFGDDAARAEELVWHRGNSGETVPPLDAKRANGFGLHAMLGGVWEWTASGEAAGERRILRGGSFRDELAAISCSARRAEPPDARFDDAGFRIAKSLRGGTT